MRPMSRWWLRARPILAVLTFVVVTACGAPASTSSVAPTSASATASPGPATEPPSPLASPSPTPSPTPDALAPEDAFRQLVSSDGWSLAADISGMVLTSAEGKDVYVNPVSGIVEVGRGDAHLLIAAPDATGTRVFEDVHAGGTRSVRGPDGAWQDAVAGTPADGLLDALVNVPPVRAAGNETVGGDELTILTAVVPVTVGTLGGVRAAPADATGTLSFLVDASGTPVLVRLDLDAPLEGMPAVEDLELAVTPRPGPVAVEPPETWTLHESDRGYAIRMPEGCAAMEGDEHWEDFLCGSYYLRIWTAKTADSSATWTRDSIAAWSRDTGAEPMLEDTLRVGTGKAGAPGTIATYRYRQDGADVVMSDGVFVHAGTGYDVVVIGLAENAARDRATFLQHLATMRFST